MGPHDARNLIPLCGMPKIRRWLKADVKDNLDPNGDCDKQIIKLEERNHI